MAMPAFEHVLQAHATSPEDWHWRRTDLDLCRVHDEGSRGAVRDIGRAEIGERTARDKRQRSRRPVAAVAGAR